MYDCAPRDRGDSLTRLLGVFLLRHGARRHGEAARGARALLGHGVAHGGLVGRWWGRHCSSGGSGVDLMRGGGRCGALGFLGHTAVRRLLLLLLEKREGKRKGHGINYGWWEGERGLKLTFRNERESERKKEGKLLRYLGGGPAASENVNVHT